MPLVNKNHSLEISALGTNDSSTNLNRKNFKTFKKVLPVFMTPNPSLAGQENSKSSVATPAKVQNESRAAESTPVKFKPRPYTPGGTRRYKPGFSEKDLHPALVTPDRGLRKEETDRTNDARNDRRREGDERIGNLITRTREIMEDNEQPSTSAGRRTSPRKKGPAIRLTRAPPPPLFNEEKIDDDDDDEEVDIWAFNR